MHVMSVHRKAQLRLSAQLGASPVRHHLPGMYQKLPERKQVFRVNSIFSTRSLGTLSHFTSCGNEGNPLEILIPNASHCQPVSNHLKGQQACDVLYSAQLNILSNITC